MTVLSCSVWQRRQGTKWFADVAWDDGRTDCKRERVVISTNDITRLDLRTTSMRPRLLFVTVAPRTGLVAPLRSRHTLAPMVVCANFHFFVPLSLVAGCIGGVQPFRFVNLMVDCPNGIVRLHERRVRSTGEVALTMAQLPHSLCSPLPRYVDIGDAFRCFWPWPWNPCQFSLEGLCAVPVGPQQ